MRKLPVYLLLDVSGSMSGEPIEAVRNGMQILRSALLKDPYALETVWISVITFGSDVQQVLPLTEVSQFNPPEIRASGGTALGGALIKAVECANKEVRKTTEEEKGDWKPLVFLMTDGLPTDDPEPGIAEFKKYHWGIVVACAAGPGSDMELLKRIAWNEKEGNANVVELETADQTSIAAFFKWVSASVASGSRQVDGGSDADQLPPPPPEITLV